MLKIVQYRRLSLRSRLGRRPRERIERRQKLRQGIGLRLISWKRKIGKGRRQGPTQMLRLRQQRGKGRGPRPRHKEKAEIARDAVKAGDKAESEAAERAREWAEAKAKEKAEIARIAAKASEKAEAEEQAKSTEKAYSAKRTAEETAAEIRVRAEAERAERDRAEAEARSNDDSEIKKKAKKMRKAREENAKAKAKTAEMARAWDEAKDKEKSGITRIYD